jgi:hypothetical protein
VKRDGPPAKNQGVLIMTQYYSLRWFEIVKHSSSYSWLDLHECLSHFPKIEALKQEQRLCLIEGDLRDSAIIQNLMLMILQVSQSGLTAETAAPLRQKVVDSF